MKTVLTMLVCAVVAVGCGRKAAPLSAGVQVRTNTVLPSPTEAEVKKPSQPPQMTTQTAVVVHGPTSIDPQEQERKRIQRMTLIDDRNGGSRLAAVTRSYP